MISYRLIDGFTHLCYNEIANEQSGAFCFLAQPSTEHNKRCEQSASIVYVVTHVPLFVGTTASTMEAFCHVNR